MRITISGRPGAGKTTIAKFLSKKLNYDFISVGNLQGKIALERGITINQLMERAKQDKSIHLEMDNKIKELGKEKDNFIIEGWIAFHFIPNSFKIFLEVNEETGAKRIFHDKREDEPNQESLEKTQEKIRERVSNVRNSFKKYYGIDFLAKSQYDLVIDTTNKTPEQIVEKINSFLKNKF
jgi:cytidylate kinase